MSTWVPKHERTNHFFLFNNLYHCRVNELAMRSIEHIKSFGVLVSGNKDLDRGIEKREVLCMLKIPDMAELHHNGVPITLVNGGDSKEIFQIIETHLATWIEYLDHEIGVGNAPIEDLQKLDKLAHVLYPVRCRNMPAGAPVQSFERTLQNVLGKRAIIKAPKPVVEKKKDDEGPKRSDSYGKLLGEYRDIQDFRRM